MTTAVRVIILSAFCLLSVSALSSNLTEQEKKLVSQVKSDMPHALKLLEETVNINSDTMNFSGVKKVSDIYQKAFDAIGFKTEWQDGKVFNRAGHFVAQHQAKNPNSIKVLLIGHLDTVFSKEDSFQRYQPISESKVKGPGVVDMKGGNAIVFTALKAMKAQGMLDDINVRVVFTGDEERSGRPLSLSKKALVDGAKWADVALGFEAGDGNIDTVMIARRSYIGWTLKVSAKSAHSSQIFREDIGFGAIYELSRILDQFRQQLSEEELLTINPGLIAGGTRIEHDDFNATASAYGKANVIAKELVVAGDIRTISPAQYEKAKAVMENIVSNNLPHTKANIVFTDGYPPMAPTGGNKQLAALYNQASLDLGYGKVVGANPRKAGAADISFAASYVDMALDGLGMMGTGGHTQDETADMTSFYKNSEKAALLLYRLSQHKK